MKISLIIIGLGLIIGFSFLLYQMAETQATYQGLPTVPCYDYTKPIVEQFTLSIHIVIDGKSYPLDKTIGHDYGNCLHDIFVKDTSGTVYIESNDEETFTLGQFFDVWHKAFSSKQIFNYRANKIQTIQVFVNNQIVDTNRETILKPNQEIAIFYE